MHTKVGAGDGPQHLFEHAARQVAKVRDRDRVGEAVVLKIEHG